jgi:hypothetical protein
LKLLEDVGVVDVVLDGVGDGVVAGYVVEFEVRLAGLLYVVVLDLLLDLNSQRQLLLLALVLTHVLQLQLPRSVDL